MATRFFFIFILLLGVSYCDDTSLSETSGSKPNPKITNPVNGITFMLAKGAKAIGDGTKIFEESALSFGSLASEVIGNTVQDLIDTVVSLPKDINGFVVDHWPKLLGGNLLRNERTLMKNCYKQSVTDRFVQVGIQETLHCIKKPFMEPHEKLKDLMYELYHVLLAMPSDIKNIGKAKTLTGLVKNVHHFNVNAFKNIFEIIKKAGKWLGVIVLSAPEAIMCALHQQIIRQPKAIIHSGLSYIDCIITEAN